MGSVTPPILLFRKVSRLAQPTTVAWPNRSILCSAGTCFRHNPAAIMWRRRGKHAEVQGGLNKFKALSLNELRKIISAA